MANPLRDLFFPGPRAEELVEALVPRRTFADVVLPAATRRALDHALLQIRKHDVIFGEWGLGERHTTGLALAFNFAGPPGTGKTICAEAVAHALGKRLLVVRYAELESQWAGATAKNVSAVFEAAREQDAVLFFDEADAIAGRRFTSVDQGYQREANAVVNVLLRELEEFPGVVIFATNLAANFDPAFERRIRTHILFEMPGAEEREQIWRGQLHSRKTPLADDVDFTALAGAYPLSGGDIKNAVLKAAQSAIAEPGPDATKRIGQRHFEGAVSEVVAGKRVMEQSLFGPAAGLAALAGAGAGLDDAGLRDDVETLAGRLVEVEDAFPPLVEALRRAEISHGELNRRLDEMQSSLAAHADATVAAVKSADAVAGSRLSSLFWMSGGALVVSLGALAAALL
jgi:hypothetical protein